MSITDLSVAGLETRLLSISTSKGSVTKSADQLILEMGYLVAQYGMSCTTDKKSPWGKRYAMLEAEVARLPSVQRWAIRARVGDFYSSMG